MISLLRLYCVHKCSVQLSHSAVSDSLGPHGLQHTRPPHPSPTPRAYTNSCLLSQWCHPTISSSVIPPPPTLNLSQHQGLLKGVSSSHQVTKILEFQLHRQSFNEYSVLISFRRDWLGLLAVQGTLKSLLQHHSSKASILRHSAFLLVQLSHPYMIRWTKALLYRERETRVWTKASGG